MEITSMVQTTKDIDIELENNLESVAILARENPSLIQQDDEIYFGDNPDIFGLFIGKENPLLEQILELIYGE